MSEGGHGEKKITLPLPIPIIRAESETQTLGLLVSRSPDEVQKPDVMEADEQKLSIRKRRNLSKNRGQATRQREKTPEAGRTPIHEDTTTSDDEDLPQRNSREIEADSTYEEMKRLVQEQAGVKDPVYDIDTDEIMEQRSLAAHERRRRSVSPFALPDKEREELCQLERKSSFTDPNNKLLSTTYSLNPKEEDSGRRNSLTIEFPKDRRSSLTPPTPSSASPIEKNMPFPTPTTPKKLDEMVNPDEVKNKSKTPISKANVFTFDDKETKLGPKTASSSDIFAKTTATKATETVTKPISSKAPETPTSAPGELVTKVIQVERTPSKKMSQENKPVVELRERIVRTPSKKMTTEARPTIIKQQPKPAAKEEPQSKVPPIKPARSKSATRFGVSFYVKLILILFVALFIAMYFLLAQ